MIHGLADIMQQTGPLGDPHVQPKLCSQQAGKVRHLHRMLQGILPEACPEFHLSKQSDQFRVNAVDPHLQGCSLALLLDHHFHFFLSLLHHLLDPGRVDTPVHNQLLQSNPGHLSADGVET